MAIGYRVIKDKHLVYDTLSIGHDVMPIHYIESPDLGQSCQIIQYNKPSKLTRDIRVVDVYTVEVFDVRTPNDVVSCFLCLFDKPKIQNYNTYYGFLYDINTV